MLYLYFEMAMVEAAALGAGHYDKTYIALPYGSQAKPTH